MILENLPWSHPVRFGVALCLGLLIGLERESAELVRGSTVVEPILVSAIIVAMMSNTIVKGVYFGTLAKPARKEAFVRCAIWALLHKQHSSVNINA